MRLIFRLFALLLICLPVVLVAAVWYALADKPLVENNTNLRHGDIVRAEALLRQNDPRQLPPGIDHRVEMTEADLNLAVNYLLQPLAKVNSRIRLKDNLIDVDLSYAIPSIPKRNYVNLSATVVGDGREFSLEKLRIGKLALPAFLSQWAFTNGVDMLPDSPQVELVRRILEESRVNPRDASIAITYKWDPSLLENVQSSLLTHIDRNAVQAYYLHLLSEQERGLGRNGSLVPLLQSMFSLALERSVQADPVAENTALLSLLGTWALGQDLKRLLPTAVAQPNRFRLKLQRRTDFGQHFLGSAALAAQGDSELADAVGTFKEVIDSDRGSGFSFTDLAADRAGIRFGDLATRSEQQARRLQALMTKGFEEADIMPPARDLPEYLGAEEFRRRYGEVGSDAYQQISREIERRIDECRLYRLLK